MEQNIKNFLEQIDAQLPEERTLQNYDADVYWSEVTKVCDKLSFEANKLSLSWLSPPLPANNDLVQMGALLELACVALLAAWHQWPVDAGAKIRNVLRDNVRAVLESCVNFVRTLSETGGHTYQSNSHPVLQSFADLSSKCDVIKVMPRSNRTICIEKLKQDLGLLKDALSELEEVNSEEFGLDEEEESEQYSEKDSQILNPSKGLIKTSIVLVKKTTDTIKKSGLENTSEVLLEYDTVLNIFTKMSPNVDDLALTLYPPIDWSECKQMNESLKTYLEVCLESISKLHFMTSDESIKWKDFVGKAVIHNFAEVQRVLITNGMAEIKLA